ncbi:MAG: hypothetical protein H0X31_03365 [Nostocaceae cyanobacterium]|nr:hypothetical protein [Nostocaceae cyanobacterium]
MTLKKFFTTNGLCLLTSAVLAVTPAQAAPAIPTTLPRATTPIPTTLPRATTPIPTTAPVKLTLQDLPEGFQELPPDVKSMLTNRLAALKSTLPIDKVPLENLFAFVQPNKLEVVMGFTDSLAQPQQAQLDATLQNLQKPEGIAQFAAKFKHQMLQVPGIQVSEPQIIPQDGKIGNNSAGMTFTITMQGMPLRMDITSFRRGGVGALTAVTYMDKAKPQVSVKDIANILDSRIVKSSTGTNLLNIVPVKGN